MNKLSLSALVVLALAITASATPMLEVITPTRAGNTWFSSGWVPMEAGFDNQPQWDGTKPYNTTYAGGNPEYYRDNNVGRWAFIDLGENWQNIRVYQLWTRYRTWSVGDTAAFAGGAWTDGYPGIWPPETPANPPLLEHTFLFDNQSNLIETTAHQWVRDVDFGDQPFTPLGRYLELQVRSDIQPVNRAEEYAIIGTVVPEPGTLCLLGLGVAAMLRRRK